MAAEDGETFEDFKLRIEGEVQALIDNGLVTAADPGIVVPLISDMCPASTQTLHADATAFVVNQILQQTMGPWLSEQITLTCAANKQEVADLTVDEQAQVDALLIATNDLLTDGLDVLGAEAEGMQDFGERLREEFLGEVTPDSASGLPAFSSDCDETDDDGLQALEILTNQRLSFTAFNAWLDNKFTAECEAQEDAIADLIDDDNLDDLEAAQEQMFVDWHSICEDCPADQTLEEFIVERGQAFVASGTATVEADFTIPEYKDSCVDYVDSIASTDAAAQTYKTNLEQVLTLDSWAKPMFEALQEKICNDVEGELTAQTSELELATGGQTVESGPIIDGFLLAVHPSCDGLDSDACKQVLLGETAAAIDAGNIEVTPLTQPTRPLPGFCEDRATAEAYQEAAEELSQQTTLKDLANFLTTQACTGFETSLPETTAALNALTDGETADRAGILETNFEIAEAAGTAPADLATFTTEERAAFEADADFEATPTGETVQDVPEGFCPEAVATALEEAQNALAEYETEAAFNEYLVA